MIDLNLRHAAPRSNESNFADFDTTPSAFIAMPVPGAHPLAAAVPPLAQYLPFTVRVVADEAQLARVQALRAAAYGHHLPGLAESFGRPDPLDRHPDTTIFFAEDKHTGLYVGTARIQTNRGGPLPIECSVALPRERRGQLLSEITRLSVLPGYNNHRVRMALVKASHIFCIGLQISGVLAGSRRALLRQYRNLGFSDLFEDERLVPLAHAGGLAHRILFRDTVTSEAESRTINHPDYGFVFRTWHPDIRIFDSVSQAVATGLGRPVPDHGYRPRAA